MTTADRTLGTRIRDFLAGDPPTYVPGRAEARTVNLMGLAIPLHSTAVLLGAVALLLISRTNDLPARFGPIDPRSLRNQALERVVLSGSSRCACSSPSARTRGAMGSGLGRRPARVILLGGLAIALTVPGHRR